MIRHILLVSFKADVTPEHLRTLEQGFYQLKKDIKGIEQVEFGQNNSPEGLNQNYSHAIVMTFVDLAARDAYLTDDYHEVFKRLFVPMIENIIVFDYEV